ncbi:MAG: class I SAM-dependent methyltransferase [Acidobacteriota bacterium]|nr:MAG: class I SAM-dependent methyltransferase [Acidobacteriota bacterium]
MKSEEIERRSCGLCGSVEADFVLRTQRLDGPLMRCRGCGLWFVALPGKTDESSEGVAAEMERLSDRALELELIESGVEQSESPWRELTARERLTDLKRFVTRGRLLEVGCSTGELLEAASKDSFEVSGVEADRRSCRIARARGLDPFAGSLRDAAFPDGHFTVAVLYHVIEHFPDPAAEIRELHRVTAPGGWLAVETPNIDNPWFRLLGARWRQFIPDHLFFFDPRTLRLLCERAGFEVVECRNVGKAMSLRLFVSRLGRYSKLLSRGLMAPIDRLGLGDLTIRLSLGDVTRLYARRRD